jgi:hypothetical protein
MSAKLMRRTWDSLDAANLLPVEDRPMELIRAECPSCRGGSTDPLGLWRPMTASCYQRDQTPRLWCAAGCSDEAIAAALQAGPVNWQAVAYELLDIARGLVVLLDAVREPAAGRLKVAA